MEAPALYQTPGPGALPVTTGTLDWLRQEIGMHELLLEQNPHDEDSHWALVHLRRLLTIHAPNDPLLKEPH